MKIAHILTQFSPEENPGGVERVVEELALRQAKEHEVEIICRNQFDDASEEKYKGLKVKRAGLFNISGLRTLSSLWTMRKQIRQSDADVFHVHDWSPYLNYFVAGEPEKSILTLHNRAFSRFGRVFQDFCIRRSDLTTAVSQSIVDRLDYGVKVIPNGAALEKFGFRESEDYYLFAGNLIEGKGISELTSVWKESWPLLKVAGSGPLLNELPEQENIEYLEEVPYSEMPDLIGRSNALILPSRSEGFGLIWAEALASGKPVLATDTGIGNEIPREYGIVIDSDFDNKMLTEGLKQLIFESDFDNEGIRSYAEDKFSWEEIASSYTSCYNGLLQ
jgi:glycosyltransferase involved in cell wall biosynthesis